jgi:hypothetical protein
MKPGGRAWSARAEDILLPIGPDEGERPMLNKFGKNDA